MEKTEKEGDLLTGHSPSIVQKMDEKNGIHQKPPTEHLEQRPTWLLKCQRNIF